MNKRDEALRQISDEVGVNLIEVIKSEAQLYKQALDGKVDHKQVAESADVVPDESPVDAKTEEVKAEEVAIEATPEPVQDTEPTEDAKETPVPATPEFIKALISAFGETYGMNELGEHIQKQNDMLTSLKAQVESANTKIAELEKSTEEKVAEQVAILPRFPWMQFRASDAKETELSADEKDQQLKASVPTNSPVRKLTDNM